MTSEQKIEKALELIRQATELIKEVQGGRVFANDSGGSNPPNQPGQPGQPGHP